MRWCTVLAIALIAPWVAMVAGSDDDPTPTPTPRPTPTRTPIVISNENLQELGSGGRITTTASEPATKPSANPISQDRGRDYDRSRARAAEAKQAGADGAMDPNAANPSHQRDRKAYWQSRYKQQLIRIEQMEQQLEALNREIPRLTSEYYSKDDPYYRDAVLKPKLDEMIATQDRVKKQLVEEREMLPKIIQEARKDGAQPGWFRGL